MEGIQNLSPAQQQILMKSMEEMQMKDSFRMYTNLVQRCFDGCVSSFRSKTLDKSELGCLEHCASRYMKLSQRVGVRFQEVQALEQKKAMEKAAAVHNN